MINLLRSLLAQSPRPFYFRSWMENLLQDPAWLAFQASFEEHLDHPDEDVVWVTANDGTPLALRAYLPEGPPRMVALVVHALTLSSRFYRGLGHFLAEHGIAALLLDVRGHGLSGGRPGDSPSRGQLLDDLALVHATLAGVYPDKPVVWIGHSMGAMLCWKMLAEGRVRPAAFVSIGAGPIGAALGRMWRTRRVIMWPRWQQLLREGFGPRSRLLHVLVPPAIRDTYGFVLDYTPRFFLAALPWHLGRAALDPGIPVLAVIGEQDQGYDAAAVGAFVVGLPGDVALQIYPEADHLNVLPAAGPAIVEWLGGLALGTHGKSISVTIEALPIPQDPIPERRA